MFLAFSPLADRFGLGALEHVPVHVPLTPVTLAVSELPNR